MFDGEAVRAPRSMTRAEQLALLGACEGRRYAARDGLLIALALGTGLREHELVALNVGDVLEPGGRVRQRVPLRVFKGHRRVRARRAAQDQEAILSDGVRRLLAAYGDHKRSVRESMDAAAPLFVSQKGHRLSTRTVRRVFAEVQNAAGLERRFTFHHTRHSFCTDLYLLTGNLRLVQRAARHASIQTTVVYTHPPDEQLLSAVRALDAARAAEGDRFTRGGTGPAARGEHPCGATDRFLNTPLITFQNPVFSQSAPGMRQGFSGSHENPTAPPAYPPGPPARGTRQRPRRVSARRTPART